METTLPSAQTTFNGDQPYTLPIAGTPQFSEGPNLSATIPGIGDNIISALLLVGGILAVLYLILGGLYYITSGGNVDRAKTGRAMIINVVIGIIVITAAFFIIRFAVGIGATVEGLD